MRDWNAGDENGLNFIPSYLDCIDDDGFNCDNPKKDKDYKTDDLDVDDVPF